MKDDKIISSMGSIHMIPMDKVAGFDVRPGLYELNGATAIPVGVNFTVHSFQATYCELLLFRRAENEPYAILPFPEHYRVGKVYSMIVFGLNIEDFEYAYRLDGPYDVSKGLLFDKNNILLDIYAKAVTGRASGGIPRRRAPFTRRAWSRTILTGEGNRGRSSRWRTWSSTKPIRAASRCTPRPK